MNLIHILEHEHNSIYILAAFLEATKNR